MASFILFLIVLGISTQIQVTAPHVLEETDHIPDARKKIVRPKRTLVRSYYRLAR